MATSTKSKQVEDYIRQSIAAGGWGPGAKLPSDKELSETLGVSYMTVKTVMSHLSTEGLLLRRKRLGTYVSQTSSTSCIGLMTRAEHLASPSGYYYRQLLQAARKEITELGLQPILTVGHGNTNDEFVNFCESPTAKRTIGVINFGAPHSLRDLLKAADIPVISIMAALSLGNSATVILDYQKMFRIGIEEMKRRGYHDYQVVHIEPPLQPTNIEYHKRFRQLISSMPELDPDKVLWLPWCGYDYEGIYHEFKRVWQEQPHPEAYFFLDDAICDNASRAILELGIKVPEQLGIITEANVGRHFHFNKVLTRVEFDPALIMKTAMELFQKVINKEVDPNTSVYVEPVLKPGETLKEAAV